MKNKIASVIPMVTAIPLAILLAFGGVFAPMVSADTDPFAAPPKNLKPQDAQKFYEIQSAGEEEVVYTGDTDSITEILSGTLQMNDDGAYLLNTGSEQITLATGKDLSSYVGQQISIETETDADGELIIKNIIIGAPDGVQGPLHAAPTGPNAWLIAGLTLIMISMLAGFGTFSKHRLLAWIGSRRNQASSTKDDSDKRLF